MPLKRGAVAAPGRQTPKPPCSGNGACADHLRLEQTPVGAEGRTAAPSHPEPHPAHPGVMENDNGRVVHRGTKGSNPLSSGSESANRRSPQKRGSAALGMAV